jgi:hypothetical protein
MDEIKSEEKSKKGKKKDYESIIKEKEKQIQLLLEVAYTRFSGHKLTC